MKKTRKSRVFRVEFRVSKLEKSSFSSRVSSRVYSKSRVFRVGFRVWVLKTRTWLETRKKSSSIVCAGHIFSLKSHRLPYDLDQLATMNILENRVQNKGGV